MQNLLSSCMVLQWFFGRGLRCYIAPLHIQNLLSSCMFFSGSSVILWGGLRCYIAPLHIQNLLSSCMVLQWFLWFYITPFYKGAVQHQKWSPYDNKPRATFSVIQHHFFLKCIYMHSPPATPRSSLFWGVLWVWLSYELLRGSHTSRTAF